MTGIFYVLLGYLKTVVERVPKLESAQKVDPGEEHCPTTAAVNRTRDLDHEPGTLPLKYPRSAK